MEILFNFVTSQRAVMTHRPNSKVSWKVFFQIQKSMKKVLKYFGFVCQLNTANRPASTKKEKRPRHLKFQDKAKISESKMNSVFL